MNDSEQHNIQRLSAFGNQFIKQVNGNAWRTPIKDPVPVDLSEEVLQFLNKIWSVIQPHDEASVLMSILKKRNHQNKLDKSLLDLIIPLANSSENSSVEYVRMIAKMLCVLIDCQSLGLQRVLEDKLPLAVIQKANAHLNKLMLGHDAAGPVDSISVPEEDAIDDRLAPSLCNALNYLRKRHFYVQLRVNVDISLFKQIAGAPIDSAPIDSKNSNEKVPCSRMYAEEVMFLSYRAAGQLGYARMLIPDSIQIKIRDECRIQSRQDRLASYGLSEASIGSPETSILPPSFVDVFRVVEPIVIPASDLTNATPFVLATPNASETPNRLPLEGAKKLSFLRPAKLLPKPLTPSILTPGKSLEDWKKEMKMREKQKAYSTPDSFGTPFSDKSMMMDYGKRKVQLLTDIPATHTDRSKLTKTAKAIKNAAKPTDDPDTKPIIKYNEDDIVITAETKNGKLVDLSSASPDQNVVEILSSDGNPTVRKGKNSSKAVKTPKPKKRKSVGETPGTKSSKGKRTSKKTSAKKRSGKRTGSGFDSDSEPAIVLAVKQDLAKKSLKRFKKQGDRRPSSDDGVSIRKQKGGKKYEEPDANEVEGAGSNNKAGKSSSMGRRVSKRKKISSGRDSASDGVISNKRNKGSRNEKVYSVGPRNRLAGMKDAAIRAKEEGDEDSKFDVSDISDDEEAFPKPEEYANFNSDYSVVEGNGYAGTGFNIESDASQSDSEYIKTEFKSEYDQHGDEQKYRVTSDENGGQSRSRWPSSKKSRERKRPSSNQHAESSGVEVSDISDDSAESDQNEYDGPFKSIQALMDSLDSESQDEIISKYHEITEGAIQDISDADQLLLLNFLVGYNDPSIKTHKITLSEEVDSDCDENDSDVEMRVEHYVDLDCVNMRWEKKHMKKLVEYRKK